jgi:hypothetical protein
MAPAYGEEAGVDAAQEQRTRARVEEPQGRASPRVLRPAGRTRDKHDVAPPDEAQRSRAAGQSGGIQVDAVMILSVANPVVLVVALGLLYTLVLPGRSSESRPPQAAGILLGLLLAFNSWFLEDYLFGVRPAPWSKEGELVLQQWRHARRSPAPGRLVIARVFYAVAGALWLFLAAAQ